jgi:hypothetical protein
MLSKHCARVFEEFLVGTIVDTRGFSNSCFTIK